MNTKCNTEKFSVQFLSGMDQVEGAEWNRLTGTGYPFLRYEFLAALESSGSVTQESGWQPQHMLIHRDDQLVALMPLYIKDHSYGEYVFDWAWADAYHRNGIHYYPKLLTAVPFTPAGGPRLCLLSEELRPEITAVAVEKIKQLTDENGYSSWHLLFPQQDESAQFVQSGLCERNGCQYHWFNRGYRDFDDFLAHLSSRKRKNIKRERRRVAEQDIRLIRVTGREISERHLNIFYTFYQATYYKRAQRGYLTLNFFQQIHAAMPEQLMLVLAYREDQPVAAALCLTGEDTLYGRYWGCLEEYECLHFEACYYQGIEFCIERNIGKFDPGAQGEHKISRGFEPIATYSLHWIRHPGFRAAIEDFLDREKPGIDQYIEQASQQLPFRKA